MQFEHLTPEEILEVNIPTGIPCAYTFDKDWNIVDKHYIGDPTVIEAKINAVANQGKELSDQDREDLDEAAELETISRMPARVKCAELAWRTLEGMLAEQV